MRWGGVGVSILGGRGGDTGVRGASPSSLAPPDEKPKQRAKVWGTSSGPTTLGEGMGEGWAVVLVVGGGYFV